MSLPAIEEPEEVAPGSVESLASLMVNGLASLIPYKSASPMVFKLGCRFEVSGVNICFFRCCKRATRDDFLIHVLGFTRRVS